MGIRVRIRRWLELDGIARETDLQALTTRIDGLEKKLKMTMGGVQASGAQLMGLHSSVDQVKAAAARASQQATTARSTAESTADGLEGLEEQLAALKERIAGVASNA